MRFHRFTDNNGRVVKVAALDKITFAEPVDRKVENGECRLTVRIHFTGGPPLELAKVTESEAYHVMDEISRYSAPAVV
jgi:hypothetical protein